MGWNVGGRGWSLGLVAIAACGDTTTHAGTDDAVDELRCAAGEEDDFVLALRSYGGGAVPSSTEFMVAAGFSYLYVRHDCTYWARDHVAQDAPVVTGMREIRTGTLDDAQLEAIADELLYPQWGEWDGDWLGDGSEANNFEFWSDEHAVRCQTGCDGVYMRERPPELAPLDDAADHVWTRLFAEGEPVTGPVRVMTVYNPNVAPDTSPCVTAQWPLPDLPIDDVAIVPIPGDGLPPSDGIRFEGADAEAFRGLRDHYLWEASDDPCAELSLDIIQVVDDGKVYEVTVRDILPFEDEQGRIDVPNFAANPR